MVEIIVFTKKNGYPLDDRFPNIEVTRFELAASTSRT